APPRPPPHRRAPRPLALPRAPVPGPGPAPALHRPPWRTALSQVSARALDEAIAWQLCLDASKPSEQQRREFDHWLAAHPEHSLVWRQLGGIDQQLAAAAAPLARRALLQGGGVRRRSLRRLAGSALGLLLASALGLGLLN